MNPKHCTRFTKLEESIRETEYNDSQPVPYWSYPFFWAIPLLCHTTMVYIPPSVMSGFIFTLLTLRRNAIPRWTWAAYDTTSASRYARGETRESSLSIKCRNARGQIAYSIETSSLDHRTSQIRGRERAQSLEFGWKWSQRFEGHDRLTLP